MFFQSDFPYLRIPNMINFHYEKAGKNKDIVVVVLSGKLDSNNSDYLLDCVEEEVLDGSRKVILDCRQISHITSMGLGNLVRVNSRMRKLGGEVKLARLQGPVAQIISVVGLNRVFQIYPRVRDAIEALGG